MNPGNRNPLIFDFLRRPIYNANDPHHAFTVEEYESSMELTLEHLGRGYTDTEFSAMFRNRLGQIDTAAAFLLAQYQKYQLEKVSTDVINQCSRWLGETGFSDYIGDGPMSKITPELPSRYSNRICLSEWNLTERGRNTDDDTRWKQFEPLFKRMVNNNKTKLSEASSDLIKLQLREILANISEHSSSNSCFVAAQYYAKNAESRYAGDDMIEISIFNAEKISSAFIKKWLYKKLDNNLFLKAKGKEQLSFALMPGFTTKSPLGLNVPQGDKFSIGSGLFLLSWLASKFGVFMLASDQSAVVVARGWDRPAYIRIPELSGTLVSFRINTAVGDLETSYLDVQKRASNLLRERVKKTGGEPDSSAINLMQNGSWSDLLEEFHRNSRS